MSRRLRVSFRWLRWAAIVSIGWLTAFSCSSTAEAPATSCWPRCAGPDDAGVIYPQERQDAASDASPDCTLDCSGPEDIVLSCGGESVGDPHCATSEAVVGAATSISVACVAGAFEFSCAAIQCSPDGGELSGTIHCEGEGASCSGSWGNGGELCGVVSSEGGPTSDLSSNEDWADLIRTLVQERRTALGCPSVALPSQFVSDAANTLAERWHRDGIQPFQDNDALVDAHVFGRTRWFAAEIEFSSAFTESEGLANEIKNVVDPDLDCQPTSLAVAIAGTPGESRTVVVIASACQDCSDACHKECSDGGELLDSAQ
ncbi:MAG TPA: hypothetical protein VHO25_09935 [Polyangiaceae bacterium]|nr:hypothetical protein [Polyangiaceae bacterium]